MPQKPSNKRPKRPEIKDKVSPSPTNRPKGRLIMAGTSLGDMRDIPSRSLEAVQTADLLVFEEDRSARSFLKAAGVHRPYLRLSEHSQRDTLESVENTLRNGQTVAYMSDQGMPNVQDPGHELVAIAARTNSIVSVIPGPSSITAALAASPFPVNGFIHPGLLPREEEPRIKTLTQYVNSPHALILIDAPYRLRQIMSACVQVFGPSRQSLLALDISGEEEEFLCGTLERLNKAVEKKLNFVLVIASVSR